MSPGNQADSGSGVVVMICAPSGLPRNGPLSRNDASPRAMKLSMIELMTSLTPRVTFRTATMPAQQGADEHRHDDDQHDVQRAGQRDGGAGRGGEDGRHPVLALDADVEQAHPEGDRHREAGEEQRHRAG